MELAACLPMIILLVFGSIEASSLLFARQAMVETAYEAAVVAVRRGATRASAETAAQQVVKAHRLQGLQLTFSPANTENAPRGSLIEVFAEVPAGPHKLIGSRIIGVDRVGARAVMVKE